jgi:protein-L-isoaspartate(D-aspartate) O-methyltransferase
VSKAFGHFYLWTMQQAVDRFTRHRKDLVSVLKGKGITDPRVLEAVMVIPRHQFIDDSAFHQHAYEDKAFPIACGQTISQPYTVAFQSQLLGLKTGEKVLEIGTGSGYQTAVLCLLGVKVFSIERHRPLYLETKTRLDHMGYKTFLTHGDGYKGLPQFAPFDKVLVTCGAPLVPETLLAQLKVGGRLVIPVGDGPVQRMLSVDRKGPDVFDHQEHGAFRFVPMLSDKAR